MQPWISLWFDQGHPSAGANWGCQRDAVGPLWICYAPREALAALDLAQNTPPGQCHRGNNPLGGYLAWQGTCSQTEALRHWAASLADPHWSQELESWLQPGPPPQLRLGDQVWDEQKPRIMAIVNLTPDSFYDGGQLPDTASAQAHIQKLVEEGADLLDFGGESSRPGSEPVALKEELQRVLPLVQWTRSRYSIPISVDTTKPQVAQACLEAGADLINDVSGLAGGAKMAQVVQQHQAAYCLMHCQGTPKVMQQNPHYIDVWAELLLFFQEKLPILAQAGLGRDKILLDPGIGFGKRLEHNLELLQNLKLLGHFGALVLLGTSNKSFIGQALGRELEQRGPASLASQVHGWHQGASLFRVHQVRQNKDALDLAALVAPRSQRALRA